MKTHVKALLLFIAFAVTTITGCKLDPPIYPEGALQNGTVTYTISGVTKTVKPAAFGLTAPGSVTPNGSIQIIAGSGVDDQFAIITEGYGTGTFDIGLITIGNYLGDTGTVTVTSFDTPDGTHGTIKGTFSTDEMTDYETNETYTNVTGTFDITM